MFRTTPGLKQHVVERKQAETPSTVKKTNDNRDWPVYQKKCRGNSGQWEERVPDLYDHLQEATGARDGGVKASLKTESHFFTLRSQSPTG